MRVLLAWPGCSSTPPEEAPLPASAPAPAEEPPAGREGQSADGKAAGTAGWDDFFTGSDSRKGVGDTCSPT